MNNAASVLSTVMPDAPAGEVLADHAVCYPADPAMALAPMLPDRLAEDFLALMVPGHTISGFSPDPWATGVADLLLSSADTSACAPRALTRLAAAADRWPHVGTAVLYPLVTSKPRCAIDAGSPALAAIAAIGSAEDRLSPGLLTVLGAVEPLLPEGAHVDLDVGTLEVTERLTAYRLAATAVGPAERARLYSKLGRRRKNAGRWAQALEADEHAVRIGRRLADDDPRYRPVLAMSLNNLASALSDNGRTREALAQSRQSVALHRDLAQIDPIHRPSLALSLTNLGIHLREQNLRSEGLAATQEAVAIRKELAAGDSVGSLADLAIVLINLSGQLADLDRPQDAVAAARDAVDISRRLVEISPAEYLLDLAVAVGNLGKPLLGLGQVEEALAAQEEAVTVYRRLAKANPAAHRAGLVRALSNAGVALAELGRHDEALARTEEAVQLARQLADADPALYRSALAGALRGLGDRLVRHDLRDDALAAFRESYDLHEREAGYKTEEIALLRRLAAIYRDIGDRENEADILLNLGAAGYRRDHGGEATAAVRRSAIIYREADDRKSEAAALTNLSALLQDEDADEAIKLSERVVAIYRELGQRDFEAVALSNLSSFLISGQRYHEAVAPARRACQLLRELSEYDGPALHNLGRALLQSGETAEAITVLRQAVTVYRQTDKGEYEDTGRPRQHADTLGYLGDALAQEKRFTEAADAFRRSADLFEAIGSGEKARKALVACCAHLIQAAQFADAAALSEQTATRCRAAGDRKHEAIALSYLAAARSDEGRHEDGIAPCEQAVALFREASDPDLAGQEAAALTNLGKLLGSLSRDEESGIAYEQAVAKWREAGQELEENSALFGSALFGLGRALFLQDRNEEAVRAYQENVQVCRSTGDHQGESRALFALGDSLVKLRRFEETAPVYRRCADVARNLGNGIIEGASLLNLGLALAQLDRFPEAAEADRRSADVCGELGDRSGEGKALIELGKVLSVTGGIDEGVPALQRAATIFRELGDTQHEARAGTTLLNIARTFQGARYTREAITAARGAVAVAEEQHRPQFQFDALMTFGLALTQHKEGFPESIAVFERAATVARSSGARVGEGHALMMLGALLVDVRQLEESVTVNRKAAQILLEVGDRESAQQATDHLSKALALLRRH